MRRIIGQVQEESDTFHGAVLFEILLEEAGGFHVDTHSTENDGEVVFVTIVDVLGGAKLLNQTSLTTDLSSDFVVWETGSRENGDFLTTGNGIHGINGRDTGLDHFFRVNTGERVDGRTC